MCDRMLNLHLNSKSRAEFCIYNSAFSSEHPESAFQYRAVAGFCISVFHF